MLLGLLGCATRTEVTPDAAAPSQPSEPDTAAEDSGGDVPEHGADPVSRPEFACPGPPEDALAWRLDGYLAYQEFYDSRELGYPFGWLLHIDGTNVAASSCDAEDMFAEYHAGVPDVYLLSFTATLPPAYPLDYPGIYELPGGPFAAEPGARMSYYWTGADGVWHLQSTAVDDLAGVELCLSRVYPDRVSGTLLYRPGPGQQPTGPVWFEFDLVEEGFETYLQEEHQFWDGSCLVALYEGYADPKNAWSPLWWAGVPGL